MNKKIDNNGGDSFLDRYIYAQDNDNLPTDKRMICYPLKARVHFYTRYIENSRF